MRLVDLSDRFETERGADSQALAGKQMLGGAGQGGNTAVIERLEQDGSVGVRGGIAKWHPTLSELKRYLWAKNGPAKNVKSLLGRD